MSLRKAEIRSYLEEQNKTVTGRGVGTLCVVAALAKVPEGELRDIVDGAEISDEIAAAILPVMESDS
jgi:hypothetical protein